MTATKTKKESRVVVKEAEQIVVPTVESFIEKAITANLPVETMERFFNLRKEMKAEAAKEIFDGAMADFQGECPVIQKKKNGGQTNGGTVVFKYAPLEVIVEQVRDLIQKHGFSYSFKTENSAEKVKVTCIVKHRAGHSESSDMETTLATKTNVMSNPQQIAATVTFNKRYAFINAFGITTGDEDIDSLKNGGAKRSFFETATDVISRAQSVKVLNDYWKKISTSDKYTTEEKEQIEGLIAAKVEEIQNVTPA